MWRRAARSSTAAPSGRLSACSATARVCSNCCRRPASQRGIDLKGKVQYGLDIKRFLNNTVDLADKWQLLRAVRGPPVVVCALAAHANLDAVLAVLVDGLELAVRDAPVGVHNWVT